MLTVPEAPPSPDFPEPVPAPGVAAPLGCGAGSGRISPMRGTRICSPSVRTRARLSCSASASGATPPAASMASVTRLPTPRTTTPGLVTAPVTWTTTLPAAAGEPPGAGLPRVETGAVAADAAGACARIDAFAVPAAAVAGADSPPVPVEARTARSARTRARMRRTAPATTAARGAIARRRGWRTGSSGSVEQARRTRSSRDRFPVLLPAFMALTVGGERARRAVCPSALWRGSATRLLWQPGVIAGSSWGAAGATGWALEQESVCPEVGGDGDAKGPGTKMGAGRLVDGEGEDLGDDGSGLIHGLAQSGLELAQHVDVVTLDG